MPQLEEKVKQLMLKLDAATVGNGGGGGIGDADDVGGAAAVRNHGSRDPTCGDVAAKRHASEASVVAGAAPEMGDGADEARTADMVGKASQGGACAGVVEPGVARANGPGQAKERSGSGTTNAWSQQGQGNKKKGKRKKGK